MEEMLPVHSWDGSTRRRLAFTVILSGPIATLLVYCVVQPILPILATRFARFGGEQMAQLVATVPAIGMLIGGLIGGWLITLLGKRAVILGAIVATGVFGVAEAFLADAIFFLVDRLLLGLGASLLGTACMTLLADLYDGEARTRAIGFLQGVGTFGSIPALLIIGLVANTVGWQASFYFFALFTIPAFVMALVAIRDDHPPVRSPNPGPADVAASPSIMRLWPIFLFVFLSSLLNTMGVTQLPFLLRTEGLTNTTLLAVILSLNSLAMGLGAILAARLQARAGLRWTLILSVLLAGLGNILAGATADPRISGMGSIVSYLGLGVLLTMSFTLVLDRTDEAARGRAVGYVYAAMFIGQFANPILLSPVNAVAGQNGTYLAIGAITVLVALVGGLVTHKKYS